MNIMKGSSPNLPLKGHKSAREVRLVNADKARRIEEMAVEISYLEADARPMSPMTAYFLAMARLSLEEDSAQLTVKIRSDTGGEPSKNLL